MGKSSIRWGNEALHVARLFLLGGGSVLVLVVCGFAFASHVSGANESGVLNRNVLIVQSGSMSPSVRTGDVVVVRNVSQSQRSSLQVGDVVTFKAANNQAKLITHRIVEVRHLPSGETFYTTKGDANEVQDSALLTPDRVVGEVEFRVPRLGYALNSFNDPEVLVRFAASLALFVFAAFMFRISRGISRGAPTESHSTDSLEKRKVNT
jgi:signal peptidase